MEGGGKDSRIAAASHTLTSPITFMEVEGVSARRNRFHSPIQSSNPTRESHSVNTNDWEKTQKN